LEGELDAEHRRHSETTNAAKRNEKRFHSMITEIEDAKKNSLRLQELVDSLNDKNKALKTQAEEAEEIAATNLSKFRKAQHDLEEAHNSLNEAEKSIGKLKAEKRVSESSARDSTNNSRASVSRSFRAGSTFGH
jgi:hypothetical protein